MDCRVKPGNDGFARTGHTLRVMYGVTAFDDSLHTLRVMRGLDPRIHDEGMTEKFAVC